MIVATKENPGDTSQAARIGNPLVDPGLRLFGTDVPCVTETMKAIPRANGFFGRGV